MLTTPELYRQYGRTVQTGHGALRTTFSGYRSMTACLMHAKQREQRHEADLLTMFRCPWPRFTARFAATLDITHLLRHIAPAKAEKMWPLSCCVLQHDDLDH